MNTSAAEMIYGKTLRLPGDIFIPNQPSQNISTNNLIKSMQKFASNINSTSIRVQQSTAVHMQLRLQTCASMFVKNNPIKPNLTLILSGSYLVISRNQNVFTILKDDIALKIVINNVKPGFTPDKFIPCSTCPPSFQEETHSNHWQLLPFSPHPPLHPKHDLSLRHFP